jgi:WD repeat-containing protein 61
MGAQLPHLCCCALPAGHESWVLDVSVHPSGSLFATGSSDARVKLWDMATRTCTQTLTQHTDQVWAVAFSSDGMLATASDDKQLIIHTEKEQGGS